MTHRLSTRAAGIALAAFALGTSSASAADITGTDRHERLRGTAAADVINAGAGFDLLIGLGGDDTLNGQNGYDRIWSGPGNDTAAGGNGHDRIYGGDGDDALAGEAGHDRVAGGAGNDTLDLGDGNDRSSGGAGNDTTTGGAGNDRIYANAGADVSSGGDGDDDLWAMARVDATTDGNTTVDRLDGGNGDDRFHTRDGEADLITCGEGKDRADLDLVDVITDATPENPNGSCETVNRREAKDKDTEGDSGDREPSVPSKAKANL